MTEDVVHIRSFGAKGDGLTDDTRAVQEALDAAAGKTLRFEPLTYRTTRTLHIVGHNTLIDGAGALIDYYGGERAVDFAPGSGTGHWRGIAVRGLAIYVQKGEAATGLVVGASDSSFDDVQVGLRRDTPNAVAFDLTGDSIENVGPSSNVFKNCAVQGQGPSAGQTGVKLFSSLARHPAGSGNIWLGGRVGQCRTAFDLAGRGNSLFGPTVEGCDTAFAFRNARGNCVFGSYLEVIGTGFQFEADAFENGAMGVFATGVRELVAGAGTRNWLVSDVTAAHLPMGLRFGKVSAAPAVLDRYEEGDWTPSLAGADVPGNYRVDSTTAKYVRIGRQVTVTARMLIASHSAGAGVARFAGLPFPIDEGTTMSGSLVTSNVAWPDRFASGTVRRFAADANQSFALTGLQDADVPYPLRVEDIITGSEIMVSITYLTSG